VNRSRISGGRTTTLAMREQPSDGTLPAVGNIGQWPQGRTSYLEG